MSVSVNSDPAVFSRLQLARALKEDPESSVIFVHSRPNPRRYDDDDQVYIPRPTHLLTPPILSTIEQNDNDTNISRPPRKRASSYSSPSTNDNPRDSIVMSEERRGSLGKQATLMDVRESILTSRQINTVSSFSPSSSQRTSLILQQPRSLSEGQTAKTPHVHSRSNSLSNSRPSSVPSSMNNSAPLRSNLANNNSSRPLSSYTNTQSRPNSVVTNQSRPSSSYNNSPSRPSSSYNNSPSRPSSSYNNSPSRPSSLVNQFNFNESDESDTEPSPKIISKINQLAISKTSQTKKLDKSEKSNKLKKVKEEEDSDSEESCDDDDSDDVDKDEKETDESSDDTPLALKVKPIIKVASPNGSIKKNSGRIEEWLNNVSGDEFSSPDPTNYVRSRRLSDYTPNQTFSASPLGRGSVEHRYHRSSTFDSHAQKSLANPNSRRKSHSELSPHRKTDLLSSPQLITGRISPNQRQDSGYWARETLAALSTDSRHQMLMNDSSSGTSTSKAEVVAHTESPQPHSKSKHRDSLHPQTPMNASYYGHYTNYASESHRKASNDYNNPGIRTNSGAYIQKHR
ncbi:13737_t:CDS:2, partial [Racocetra persica]